MKLIYFCFIILLNCWTAIDSFAQKGVVGTYENVHGTRIEVRDSSLIVISSQRYYPEFMRWRLNDTIAVCSWERVADGFIRIDSPSCYERVQKSYIVKKTRDASIPKKFVKLSFSLPVHAVPVEIRLLQEGDTADSGKEILIQYPSKRRVIIPNRPYSVYINTRSYPEVKSSPFLLGQSEPPYSKSFFAFPFLLLNVEKNYGGYSIDVNLPCMDDSFFERSWIKGEFIQIFENTIIWHGELFIKQRKRNNRASREMPLNRIVGLPSQIVDNRNNSQ